MTTSLEDALATLEREDSSAAADAASAREWLTGGDGLDVLDQEFLEFLYQRAPAPMSR